MMNWIWLALICASVVAAAFTGNMLQVTTASMEWAKKAVTLAIGLIGAMAFWLGMMRVARDAGLLRGLTWLLRPVMTRLFPGVPAGHPAMSAMVMNIAANMMGLVNAATPFGIKAMQELDRLNPRKGTATNAMCLFLAINTSNVAVLPLGVIALRVSVGSADPAGIILTTIVGTSISTVVAIVAASLLVRLRVFRATDPGTLAGTGETGGEDEALAQADPESVEAQQAATRIREARSPLRRALVWGTVLVVAAALVAGPVWRHFNPEEAAPGTQDEMAVEEAAVGVDPVATAPLEEAARAAAEANRRLAERGLLELLGDVAAAWLLPLLMLAIAFLGWARGVRVYESLVEGAREGFQVAVRIIPYLVAILVAVGMFQASGLLGLLIAGLTPITTLVGLPAEVLPIAFLRPLSGSGSYGVLAHIMETHGADGYIGMLASTMEGSTETTFYVLAVYFGAVGIRRVRHALPSCLIADVAGVFGAVFAVNLFL